MTIFSREEANALIKMMQAEAAQLEEDALSSSSEEAEKMRGKAAHFRQKISEMKGERLPTRESESGKTA